MPSWSGLALGGLLLFSAVELGGPLVVRVQLDATAAEAAAAGGREWLRGHDLPAAEAAAREEVLADGATLERFEILADGRVALSVTKEADARVLDGVEQLASWYLVRVDATSSGSTL